MIKQSVTFDNWKVDRHENHKTEVYKNGELCPKSAPALREIAKELGLEISPEWRTSQLSSNVLKAMFEAGQTEPVPSPSKEEAKESKPTQKNNSTPETKTEPKTISFDKLLGSLAEYEEEEGITLYQLCKTDTTACLIYCDKDAMGNGGSYPLDKSLPDFLKKIKKLADKGNLNAIQFWARVTWQERILDDDELMDILIKKKWLRYVSDEVLENMAEYTVCYNYDSEFWGSPSDKKIRIGRALQSEIAQRRGDIEEIYSMYEKIDEEFKNDKTHELELTGKTIKEATERLISQHQRLRQRYEGEKNGYLKLMEGNERAYQQYKELERERDDLRARISRMSSSSSSYSSASSGSSRNSANDKVRVEIKYKSQIKGMGFALPKTKVVTMTNAEYRSLRDGSMKTRIAYVTNNCGVVTLVETVSDVSVSLA